MTRGTFTERLRAYERRYLWLLAVGCLVVIFTAGAGLEFWSHFMEPGLGEPDGPEERQLRARRLSPVLLSIAGMAALVRLLVLWAQIRTARRLGLGCPSCGALLLTRKYRYTALGAGKCGRCQARVLEDAPASGVPLPTRNEFLARREAYQADWQRWDPKLHGVWLCFLPGALAVWPLTVVEPCLGPAGSWLAMLLFLIVLGSPVLVYVHYLDRWQSRLRKRHGLACSWCGAAFTGVRGRSAADTGRCGACGQPAISDAV